MAPSRRSVTPSAAPQTTARASQPAAAQTPKKKPATAQARTPQSSSPTLNTLDSSPAVKPTSFSSSSSSSSASSLSRGNQDARQILEGIYSRYVRETPQRIKLVDIFLAFLVAVGALQFAYCVLAGNYPFNAFLSGFSATVGQFVLTISLRMQSDPGNKAEFRKISPERAFADYVLGSLILHFFCVNFIN